MMVKLWGENVTLSTLCHVIHTQIWPSISFFLYPHSRHRVALNSINLFYPFKGLLPGLNQYDLKEPHVLTIDILFFLEMRDIRILCGKISKYDRSRDFSRRFWSLNCPECNKGQFSSSPCKYNIFKLGLPPSQNELEFTGQLENKTPLNLNAPLNLLLGTRHSYNSLQI